MSSRNCLPKNDFVFFCANFLYSPHILPPRYSLFIIIVVLFVHSSFCVVHYSLFIISVTLTGSFLSDHLFVCFHIPPVSIWSYLKFILLNSYIYNFSILRYTCITNPAIIRGLHFNRCITNV